MFVGVFFGLIYYIAIGSVAGIIYSQTDRSEFAVGCSGGGVCIQEIGQGNQSIVDTYTVFGNSTIEGFKQTVRGGISEFSDNNYTATSTQCGAVEIENDFLGNVVTYVSLNDIEWSTDEEERAYFFNNVTLKNNCFYQMHTFRIAGAGGIHIFGTTSTDAFILGGTSSSVVGLEDFYFILQGITTNITIIEPSFNQVTFLNTFPVQIFFNNESGIADRLIYNLYDRITELLVETTVFNIGTSTEIVSATSTHPLGIYRIEAFLLDSITQDIFSTVVSNFTVISDPTTDILGFDPDDFGSILSLATTTCSISNLSGCFQNALIFTFYPSPESLARFGTLQQELSTKPPFAYIGMLTDAMKNLTGNATPIFVLASEGNVTTNIFDPLKTGMTWLLWFVWGFWLYNRVKKMEI